MKFVAKFAFQGNPSESQLSFPAGAILEQFPADTRQTPGSGWMHGYYQGQKGWFPANYVDPLASSSPTPPGMSSSMPPAPPPIPEANIVVQPMSTNAATLSASAPPMAMASAVPMTDNYDSSSNPNFNAVPPPLPPKKLNENQISQLIQQGYTRGLALSINDSMETFFKRIWVIDNSGSMQKADGHRLVETGRRQQVKFVECSRWEEITECVAYHIQLSALLQAPTSFRLLNDPGAHVGPQQFTIDTSGNGNASQQQNDNIMDPQQALQIVRKARPGGCTPLTDHILAIQAEVEALAPQLRAHGQKVSVTIATDGLPTDDRGYGGEAHQQQFVNALRMLEGLPVWLVIRLCTDESDVVDFYNDLDQLLELSMEVLDDFEGEAAEVHEHNAWLNYALPIHRLREMGHHDRLFDMLDERALTKTELRDFCGLLVGEAYMDGMPDPSADWEKFLRRLDYWLKQKDQASAQYNPMRKKVGPWLDLKKMNQVYGDGSCVIL